MEVEVEVPHASPSAASNLGDQLSNAFVDGFLSELEEKIGTDIIRCDNRSLATNSFCDGPMESRLGHDQLDMNDLRTAWSESDKLLLREEKSETVASCLGRANDSLSTKTSEDEPFIEQNNPSTRSLSSSNLMLRSSTYRMLFGNDDDDEVMPDNDFLDDWDS